MELHEVDKSFHNHDQCYTSNRQTFDITFVNLSSCQKFTFYFQKFFAPIPLPTLRSMDEQPNQSLQSFFVQFRIVQHFSQQLTVVEDNLIELSDFFEEEGIRQPTDLIEHMRAEVRQLRVHLDFVSSLKLLQACRLLQQHLQRHGRLPLFDLNFG